MLRYISSILLLLCTFTAFSQEDSALVVKTGDTLSVLKPADSAALAAKPKDSVRHQLRFNVDIFKPIVNAFMTDSQVHNKRSYEFLVDYYWKKELYFVAEGGFGGIDVDYSDLKYSSSNSFFKLGVDKSMLSRIMPGDWDMAFIGVRYGVAFINRSDATYTSTDSYWGMTTGTVPAKNITAHWAELDGGVRLEVYKRIFLGWNIRVKFLLNQKALVELPPAYIAGYGSGDKKTIFDFGFFVGYALRW